MSINTVTMTGYLGRDPELAKTTTGISITAISIGVTRSFKNKTTGKYDTDWFDWIFFKDTADAIQTYLHKGDLVTVTGNAQRECWDDRQTGQKRYRITFIGSSIQFPKRSEPVSTVAEEVKAQSMNSYNQSQNQDYSFNTGPDLGIDSDELPF